MKKLDGKLSISRRTGGDSSSINIEFIDDLSGTLMAKADISMENFAKAVTGQGYLPCEVMFNDSGIVGKTREHKYELIPRYDSGSCDISTMVEWYKHRILPTYEIDGWKCRESDLTNHHNYDGKKVKVLFERYVETSQEDKHE